MEEKQENKGSENSEVVALVNKEQITKGELESYANQIATIQKLPLPEKGTEERKKFERQALDQVINNILLSQDAENQEIKVDKEKIDSQYSAIVNQVGGEEKLNQALDKANMKAEHLRRDLSRQNVIEKYFDFVKEKNDIKVTEEEIKAFYDEKVAPQKPDLELEKIEPQIRQSLIQQKLRRPISDILKNLREEAEIKVLL